MKSRIGTAVIISILLGAALVALAFTTVGTINAVQSFQQQHRLARAGDVRTIRPWMTLPYVAHTYHIPESYLYDSLHIPDTYTFRHMPLQALASHYKRSVPSIVHDVQNVVTLYRRQHPYHHSNPTTQQYTGMSWRSAAGGRGR